MSNAFVKEPSVPFPRQVSFVTAIIGL